MPDLFVIIEPVVDDVVDVEEVVHHLALVGVRTLGAKQTPVGTVTMVELDNMPHLQYSDYCTFTFMVKIL